MGIDPRNVYALLNKGVALGNLGRHQEAIEYYDRALGIDPRNVNALNNKANALASLVESVEPIVYDDNNAFSMQINYKLIPAVTTENTTANIAIAYDEIIKIYDRALAIEPNDITVITNKGIAFYNLARYNEAIEIFDQGLKIDPNHVGCLYNKGLVLEELGKYAEAE